MQSSANKKIITTLLSVNYHTVACNDVSFLMLNKTSTNSPSADLWLNVYLRMSAENIYNFLRLLLSGYVKNTRFNLEWKSAVTRRAVYDLTVWNVVKYIHVCYLLIYWEQQIEFFTHLYGRPKHSHWTIQCLQTIHSSLFIQGDILGDIKQNILVFEVTSSDYSPYLQTFITPI